MKGGVSMCVCMAPVPTKLSDWQNETRSRQLVFPMGIEACISEDDFVRFFAAECEKLTIRSVCGLRRPTILSQSRPPPDGSLSRHKNSGVSCFVFFCIPSGIRMAILPLYIEIQTMFLLIESQ